MSIKDHDDSNSKIQIKIWAANVGNHLFLWPQTTLCNGFLKQSLTVLAKYLKEICFYWPSATIAYFYILQNLYPSGLFSF